MSDKTLDSAAASASTELKGDQPAITNSKRVWILVIVALLLIWLLIKVVEVLSVSAPVDRATASEFSTPSSSEPADASSIKTLQSVANNKPAIDIQAAPNRPRAVIRAPEESLTPKQYQQRLLLAKQEATLAEQSSRARVEQLQRVLLPADDELESLAKVEVGYVVERWREAWSKGDIDRYLSSYSAAFTPSNHLTLDAWRAHRRSRVKPQKKIVLGLSDFDIAVLNQLNAAVIEFTQHYQSGSYIETSRKRLSLAKQQGAWKIISEVELD